MPKVVTIIQGKTTTPNYKLKNKRVTKDESEWTVIEKHHEPIIDKNDFELVQKLLKLDLRTSPNEETLYPFAGILFCADCGAPMTRKVTTSRGKKYNYYICSTHKHGGNYTAHRIKEDELKEIVLYEIQLNVSLLIDIETVIAEIEADPARNAVAKAIEKRVAAANAGIKKINAAIADLYIDYKDGLFDKDDFLTLKKNYEKQLTESKNALKLLNEQLKDSTSGKVDSNTFAELKKYKNIQTLSREIIVRLIDRIDFYEDNRINITFSFEDEYAAVVEAISNSETEAV